jgi:hypothetical protein
MMDNLTATALAARKAGMSYGNYVALYGVRKVIEPIVVDEPKKLCKACGEGFYNKRPDAVYCSDSCRAREATRRATERYRRRKKEVANG